MSPIFRDDRNGLSLTDDDVVVAIPPLCPSCVHSYHAQDRCEAIRFLRPLTWCECPGAPPEHDPDLLADDLAAEQAFGGWNE